MSPITKREGKAASTEPPAGWQNTDHMGIIVLFGAGFSRPGILAGPKTHYAPGGPGGAGPRRVLPRLATGPAFRSRDHDLDVTCTMILPPRWRANGRSIDAAFPSLFVMVGSVWPGVERFTGQVTQCSLGTRPGVQVNGPNSLRPGSESGSD